ncbi:MAG: ADP-heptose--LPS heptosyltransferase [Ignavibacteriae bacterium]|nr:MAG: ADP-heptose--LPS heptosyltransferase [Ignavibacteriota bacterium]
MFTPALSILKKELPNAQIDALVMFKGVKELYTNLVEIDNVHYHDMINASKFSTVKFILNIRNNYDCTINIYPSNRKEYNLVNFTLNAKKRIGIDYLHQNLRNLGFLNNARVNETPENHCVEENVRLIEKIINKKITDIPNLNFPLHESDKNFAESFLLKKNISEDDFVIGVHAGCSLLKNHIKRRWAPENFVKLSKLLIEKHKAKILLFGGPDENELKNFIKDKVASGNLLLVSTKNLSQTAAIIKRTNLFITNDSGLMHIAAAMKRRIVPLIGPTNTNYIHPWKTDFRIASLNLDCSPCFYYSPKPLSCDRTDTKFKCMTELSVEYVYKTIKEFIFTEK